jgi:hypothetical protein
MWLPRERVAGDADQVGHRRRCFGSFDGSRLRHLCDDTGEHRERKQQRTPAKDGSLSNAV